MSFFRNPEIKKSIIIYILATIALTVFGSVSGIPSWLLAPSICVFFVLAHFLSTYKRYRRLSDLSLKIDEILHGQEGINLNEYSEGELSVLQNEVQKLVVRLREQSDALRQDKVYLADSIADISHQIRTPLTTINIILSFLSRTGISEERRLELTNELKMLISRIDWLISALLKIAKLDAGTVNFQKDTISVQELIKRAAEAIAIPMELREQKLQVAINGNVTYEGDLPWSVEAVENILKNCMEHTPAGGTINISATENAIYTEISISDNGYGIAEEDLPHIFERFYKGKNSSDQSIGIGLALARMIITKQNGTVKADNNKGAGARFTIRFYKNQAI